MTKDQESLWWRDEPGHNFLALDYVCFLAEVERGSSSFPPTRMWIKLGEFLFLIFTFSSADLG